MAHPINTLPDIPYTTFEQARRTGEWRFQRPELDADACIMCERCIQFCPDVAIHEAPDEAAVVVDFDFCKGCGICAEVCPTEAFAMRRE